MNAATWAPLKSGGGRGTAAASAAHPALGDHEQREADGGADELGDDACASPAFLVAAQQSENEQEQAAGEGRLAGPVDGPGRGVA